MRNFGNHRRERQYGCYGGSQCLSVKQRERTSRESGVKRYTCLHTGQPAASADRYPIGDDRVGTRHCQRLPAERIT